LFSLKILIMDIREYTEENLFHYELADIQDSMSSTRHFLDERGYPDQYKDLVIVIPNRKESKGALLYTTDKLARSNVFVKFLEGINKEKFRVSQIILSDQSPSRTAYSDEKMLREVSDSIYDDLSKIIDLIPEIYHLRFDREMSRMVYDYLGGYLKMSRDDREEPLVGKGLNMALSSLAASDIENERGTVIAYFDADNKQVNYKDPFQLGAPLIYKGSPFKLLKSCFKRTHLEKLGGRVDAGHGVPLIHMLIYKNVIPTGKPIIYPYSGEVAIDQEYFWSLSIPKKWSVEMLTLAQTPGKLLLQSNLGKNDDKPLAENKSHAKILEEIHGMAKNISRDTVCMLGEKITKVWKSPEEFMGDFREFQECSIERWAKSHDCREITGGITPKQLKDATYTAIEEPIRMLYEGSLTLGEDIFIPPISGIRGDMGGKFDELRERMIDKKKLIFPRKSKTAASSLLNM